MISNYQKKSKEMDLIKKNMSDSVDQILTTLYQITMMYGKPIQNYPKLKPTYPPKSYKEMIALKNNKFLEVNLEMKDFRLDIMYLGGIDYEWETKGVGTMRNAATECIYRLPSGKSPTTLYRQTINKIGEAAPYTACAKLGIYDSDVVQWTILDRIMDRVLELYPNAMRDLEINKKGKQFDL